MSNSLQATCLQCCCRGPWCSLQAQAAHLPLAPETDLAKRFLAAAQSRHLEKGGCTDKGLARCPTGSSGLASPLTSRSTPRSVGSQAGSQPFIYHGTCSRWHQARIRDFDGLISKMNRQWDAGIGITRPGAHEAGNLRSSPCTSI